METVGAPVEVNEQIKLAAKMLEARDSLRKLLGEKYDAVVGPVRALLAAMAETEGSTVLALGGRLATEAQNAGADMAAWQIIAAAVDVSEGK